LQNLEPQGLRGQNLENKGVSSWLPDFADTASALTMICSLDFPGQGQMSQGLVENWDAKGNRNASAARGNKA
jgi:hypothetical protein